MKRPSKYASQKAKNLFYLATHSTRGLPNRVSRPLRLAGLIDDNTGEPLRDEIERQVRSGEIFRHRGIGDGTVLELCNWLYPEGSDDDDQA